MRSVRSTLLCLLALSACGDDTDGPTACDVGPDIVSAATSRLLDDPPPCAQDEECVSVPLRARCEGFQSDLCDAIVHRAAAARWDAKQICRDIERSSVPSKYACVQQASCADIGSPVCRAGRCVGSYDL